MESAPSKAAGRAAEGMASLQSATAAQFAVCGVEEMAKSWKLFPLDAIGVMTKMMSHTTAPLKSLLSYKGYITSTLLLPHCSSQLQVMERVES